MRLIELYDHAERKHAVNVGMRREALPGLVRYVDLVGDSSTVLYSRLDERSIDSAIEEQKTYFAKLGHELEWKAYSHDTPPDLIDRLRTHGFLIDEREAIVVLDLESPQGAALSEQPTPAVRQVSDPQQVPERIRDELRASPGTLSVYIAEVDGLTVAHGWARFPPESRFASLWGGETLPQFRNRGLYTQLVRARVQEARARGYRYVTVDARSTSRPILERRGFQILTWATACTLPPPG
ncbi:MAG: GNAT family N-acetyltransferase [Chloroflexi bacterium]|nr:GNAT family N-acetyltransferase [Chloroflexota bacterium]